MTLLEYARLPKRVLLEFVDIVKRLKFTNVHTFKLVQFLSSEASKLLKSIFRSFEISQWLVGSIKTWLQWLFISSAVKCFSTTTQFLF